MECCIKPFIYMFVCCNRFAPHSTQFSNSMSATWQRSQHLLHIETTFVTFFRLRAYAYNTRKSYSICIGKHQAHKIGWMSPKKFIHFAVNSTKRFVNNVYVCHHKHITYMMMLHRRNVRREKTHHQPFYESKSFWIFSRCFFPISKNRFIWILPLLMQFDQFLAYEFSINGKRHTKYSY